MPRRSDNWRWLVEALGAALVLRRPEQTKRGKQEPEVSVGDLIEANSEEGAHTAPSCFLHGSVEPLFLKASYSSQDEDAVGRRLRIFAQDRESSGTGAQ